MKQGERYPNQRHSLNANGMLHVESVNDEPTMTQQNTANEADINLIMKRYETTGQFNTAIKTGGKYQDFTQITDYKEMLETVIYAGEAFQTLPPLVRLKFQNNPGELLTFLQDPNNKPEAITLGLIDDPSKKQTSNPPPPNLFKNDSNDNSLSKTLTKTKKTTTIIEE